MNYKLAKKLKDAGFPKKSFVKIKEVDEFLCEPTLSELIEACGDGFTRLETCKMPDIETNIERIVWFAYSEDDETTGYAPDEAVANLWLELNKK